jgi:hypothetical protein
MASPYNRLQTAGLIMPFNWNDYYTFAQDLDNLRNTANNGRLTCSQEAIDRCIVSRAYYAAFHHSKKFAEREMGEKFSNDKIHEEVRRWFISNNQKGIFYDLREFSKWRNQCDYDDDVANLPKLIRDSRKMAGKIIHAF